MIVATSEEPAYLTRISDGTNTILIDTAAAKGGGDGGMHPHDLLQAALASCISITLRMYAANHQMPLTGVLVRVDQERTSEATVLRYEVELQGDLTEEQRTRLLEISGRCPVGKTLSGPIRLERL